LKLKTSEKTSISEDESWVSFACQVYF